MKWNSIITLIMFVGGDHFEKLPQDLVHEKNDDDRF